MTASTREVVEVVADAAERFRFSGTTVEVPFDFGAVWVVAHIDEAERAARAQSGLTAVKDYSMLDALSGLPHDLPISRLSLPEHTRAVLDRLPPGVIDCRNGEIKRLVRRPVQVAGAITVGRWARASRRVGHLGTLCPVAVVTHERPRAAGTPMLEAAIYGQGLVWREPTGDLEIMQFPEPSLALPGAFQWLLCEFVYDELLTRASRGSPTV